MLVLWLNLQRAVHAFSSKRNMPVSKIAPWDCEDRATSAAWDALTVPANLHALKEWLLAEKANQNVGIWTEVAVAHCERRAGAAS